MSKKHNNRSNSAFSNFFRNASKKDREAMFKEVGKKACEAQRKTLDLAKTIEKAADLTGRLLDNLDDMPAAKELHELMESLDFDDQVVVTKRACALLAERRAGAA